MSVLEWIGMITLVVVGIVLVCVIFSVIYEIVYPFHQQMEDMEKRKSYE